MNTSESCLLLACFTSVGTTDFILFFFFQQGDFYYIFFFFHTSAHFNQVWNFQVPPKTPITLKAVDSVSPPKKNTLVLHKFKIHTRAKYHATKTIPVSQSFDSETYLFFFILFVQCYFLKILLLYKQILYQHIYQLVFIYLYIYNYFIRKYIIITKQIQ